MVDILHRVGMKSLAFWSQDGPIDIGSRMPESSTCSLAGASCVVAPEPVTWKRTTRLSVAVET